MNFGLRGFHGAAISQYGFWGRLLVRRISTPCEAILSATLLILGIFMLYEASSINSASETASLIGGAVCFALGMMTLVSAIRSILWHRHMLRQSTANRDMDGAAREHNRGWREVA
jgi:hypothetical protein